jgi:hypothetical protein
MTIDERLEAVTQSLELLARMHVEGEERHNREMGAMRAYLNHAVRFAVREARNERKRRKELELRTDEKITQLAAAQLITEERMQELYQRMDAFIRSLEQGRNGGSPQRSD